MSDKKTPREISKDFDVYVRPLDQRPPSPSFANKQDEYFPSGLESASKRTIPRHIGSSGKKSRGYIPTDTKEIHEMIKKISEMVEILDEKEKRMTPFGPTPYQPLAPRYRQDIDSLVHEGNIILDDLQDTKRNPAQRPQAQLLKEHELKGVLIDLKMKLIQLLPPHERNYYDNLEREQLKKRMEDVEIRIMDIINDIETNEMALEASEQRKKAEQDRLRKSSSNRYEKKNSR